VTGLQRRRRNGWRSYMRYSVVMETLLQDRHDKDKCCNRKNTSASVDRDLTELKAEWIDPMKTFGMTSRGKSSCARTQVREKQISKNKVYQEIHRTDPDSDGIMWRQKVNEIPLLVQVMHPRSMLVSSAVEMSFPTRLRPSG
jgi:hypothetical protein